MKKYIALLVSSALLMGVSSISSTTSLAQNMLVVSPVASVDLARYVGLWYEIARLPNRFQKDCASDVTAQYTSREDGNIDVVNRCKKSDGQLSEAVGVARVADKVSHAKLKVRFAPEWMAGLPFVWGHYWVLDLAPDYSYAVVGGPERDYLWVLSRTPDLPEAIYQAAIAKVAAQGFDISKLVKTKQE